MAIKNTTSTRWHVNVDIPEIKATLERFRHSTFFFLLLPLCCYILLLIIICYRHRVKNMPYEIQLRNTGQCRQETTEITINALADPTDTGIYK